MNASAALPCRLLAIVSAAVLSVLLAMPIVARASHEGDLTATLQLPEGKIEFGIDTGTLHFFDEEGAPFMVQVIDGCAVNGHYWVLGAGLGDTDAPLTVFDERSGRSHRMVLPAYQPGEAIAAILEPEALAICREGPRGGIPEIGGTATYTSVTPRCTDDTDSIELLSLGREDAYRAYVRDGTETDAVVRDAPIAVVDDSADWDELHLLAEGRTPRTVEGVLFSGDQGMLPGQASLDKALKKVTQARVRRAFEAAKSWTVPQPLIDDLGLKGVDCVYHVSLEFDTLGSDAYLAQAGWIKDGGMPILPPQLVEERFAVELLRADGESTLLPLTGPYEGSDGAGRIWEHASESAQVELIDACALTGAFWIIAAALTEEPLELAVTDLQTGTISSQLLWTDREDAARLTDTASMTGSCP